jgi:hypothetical protein
MALQAPPAMSLLRRSSDKVEGTRHDLVQLHRNERTRLAKLDHEAKDQHERDFAISNLLPPLFRSRGFPLSTQNLDSIAVKTFEAG